VASRSSKEARLGRYPNRNKKPDLGRTKSEIGFGKSQKASGKAVSGTNLGKSSSPPPKPSKAPKARRNPLATPKVGKAVESLRTKYGESGRTKSQEQLADNIDLQTERNAKERRLQDYAAPKIENNTAISRTDFIGKQNQAKQNTRLNAEGTKVERFRGRRPVGTPRVGETTRAARDGKLRRDGKRFTTPEIRQTRRKVRRAKREVRKARSAVAKGGMPANVPAEYAKWIRKYSPRIDKMARQTYGLSGNEFMAKMLQGESGFDMSKVGPDTPYGNARGAAQFIPPTRDSFVEKFGIDPWRSTREAVEAMALHLDGKSYSKTFGIQGYNPGINDSYYLDQDVGPTTRPSPGARRRLDRAEVKAETIDQEAARLGLPGTKGLPKEGKRDIEENYEIRKEKGEWAGSQAIVQKILGAGPNLASDKEARGTGSYHDTGNLTAYAQDIPISGGLEEGEPVYDQSLLDRVTRRIRRMGGEVPDLKMGMGYVTGYLQGYTLEIIPDSLTNSHGTGPHLHIGAKWTGTKPPPGTTLGGGDSVATGSVGPGGTSFPSTSPSAGGSAPGPTKRKTRQQRIIQQLRALGYRVDSKGIKKIDNKAEQPEETLSQMRERYGIK
jgi:hypothetical protein